MIKDQLADSHANALIWLGKVEKMENIKFQIHIYINSDFEILAKTETSLYWKMNEKCPNSLCIWKMLLIERGKCFFNEKVPNYSAKVTFAFLHFA